MLNVKKIREDFPILNRKVYGKQLIYLDNAATTQKPRQVIEAMDDYYELHNSNVHRAVHKLSQEATAAYDEAHEKVAEFIGAAAMQEIIFTKNATESLNLATPNERHPRRHPAQSVLRAIQNHAPRRTSPVVGAQ